MDVQESEWLFEMAKGWPQTWQKEHGRLRNSNEKRYFARESLALERKPAVLRRTTKRKDVDVDAYACV